MSKSLTWIWLFIIILSTGCSSISLTEQSNVHDTLILDASRTIGQTFRARFDGMNGIEIYLEPVDFGNGKIQLTLQEGPNTEIFGQAGHPIGDISSPGYYLFPLPLQSESNQQNYYLRLEIEGEGSLKIGTAPGYTYLNGALYKKEQPDDHRQMAFHLSYAVPQLLLGLVGEFLTWTGYILIAGFLFALPGWVLLGFVLPKKEETDWFQKLAISIGISLVIYPVLLMVTNAFGLQLGWLYAWFPPILGLVIILWCQRNWFREKSLERPRLRFGWFDPTLVAIILILFFARFWIIRSVEIPLWGDSYQHTMITQLMLDYDGLFSSWQPYIPYYSLTSHFGFSAYAALFSWISGTNGIHATLWMGQILNGLAVLMLYPLALKISQGNRWAGIGVLLVSGLILVFPATYVNWGRYAQLAGQAVMPIALWMLWEALDRDHWSLRLEWPRLMLAGMALTSMTLSYYRMPFFYATFVIILLFFWGLPKWRLELKKWGGALMRLFIVGIVGVILFIPWGIRLLGGNLAGAIETGVTDSTSFEQISQQLGNLSAITGYVPLLFFILVGITLLIALLQRNWMVVSLPLWYFLLVAYMAGSTIKLPGANMLQAFSIMIGVYIPIGLLLGWGYGQILQFMQKSKVLFAGTSLLTILVAVWFGWQQRTLLDLHQHALVLPPDQKAMAWIDAQTPSNAQLLVQSFAYVGTGAGSDGGWWLPLLARRANMLPPQYAQFNEVSQPPDYTQKVVALIGVLSENPIYTPESIAALCDWGITHIYHGQGQGQVGYNVSPLYLPEDLRSAPDLFTQIYHQDRVSIFAINPNTCSNQP